MKKIVLLLFLITSAVCYCQKGLAFKEAVDKGISVNQLDSDYKSAIHAETDKAVFKSPEEQEKLITAHQDFLLSFGEYLDKNNFSWSENTRAFNRIYLDKSGKVDYFLYDFKTPLSKEKQQEFERLLNLYIKSHSFGITAPVNFAQCSHVTFPKTAAK
jgi:hypothetical protein